MFSKDKKTANELVIGGYFSYWPIHST